MATSEAARRIAGGLQLFRCWTTGLMRSAALLICTLTGLDVDPYWAAQNEQTLPPLEYQVKAAFLLNFTKFVEWPETAFGDPDAPIAICILGNDPFVGALDQIVEGETVERRKVVVERIRRPPPKLCRVLFVSRPEKDLRSLLSTVGPAVLTVGENESFLSNGGMINFVVENRRVRFDINQRAVTKGELKISSRLLKVARAVEK